MGILTAIGTGVAWLNYRRAKAAYDEAKEEEQAFMTAVNLASDWEEQKYELYNHLSGGDIEAESDGNSRLKAVTVASVIRVGNLVGDLFRAQIELIFINTSTDREYNISGITAQGYIGAEALNNYIATSASNITLKAGETVHVTLKGAKTAITSGGLKDLRGIICEACGKKLITSCPNVNINNIGYTNVEFMYISKSFAGSDTRAVYRQIPSVIRYCGEAFYPSENV